MASNLTDQVLRSDESPGAGRSGQARRRGHAGRDAQPQVDHQLDGGAGRHVGERGDACGLVTVGATSVRESVSLHPNIRKLPYGEGVRSRTIMWAIAT